MLSHLTDERAAMAFDDLASAIDAGLPLESLGSGVELGDHVLLDLASQRGVKLTPAEKIALETGWKAGKGAATLRARAANRRRRAAFVRSLWGQLAYPVLLLCAIPIAAACVSSIIGFDMLLALAGVYGCGIALLLLFVRKLARGDRGLERWPGVGKILDELREVPYLETLHALYGAGVPIVAAHRDAVRAVRMQGLRERLVVAQRMLEEGKPLREALQQSASLHHETRQLLATGEQAGDLEHALERALIRRQDMAANRTARFARIVGATTYALAAFGVFLLAWQFYSKYYAALSGSMRR